MSFTRKDLIKLHQETCDSCRQVLINKNHDYSGGIDDPFANFNASEFIGIPPELGILMRCMDKFKRIQAFVNTGTLKVKSESVEDAIDDSINYLILLKGLIRSKQLTRSSEQYDGGKV